MSKRKKLKGESWLNWREHCIEKSWDKIRRKMDDYAYYSDLYADTKCWDYAKQLFDIRDEVFGEMVDLVDEINRDFLSDTRLSHEARIFHGLLSDEDFNNKE